MNVDHGMPDGSHEDGYDGRVTVQVGERTVQVDTSLRGYFEPVDGRYHWYGRLSADATLTELVGSGKADATVTTEHGQADCQLSDLDPWGRLRIAGVSTPPFPTAKTLEDLGRDAH